MNRELIIRGLAKKRLVSLAKSLGEFSTDGATRDELMDKMQRSSKFGTLALLDFLTLTELKTVARRLGVDPKAREKMILRDRIFASPMLRTKKANLGSAKPKPKPEPKPRPKPKPKAKAKAKIETQAKPKPKSNQKSKPIKRFVIKRVHGRDSRADFVYCPICGQEKTFYQLARHVSRMHPKTLDYQIYVQRQGSRSSVCGVSHHGTK
tara:strand:+ start:3527 stop:4150 length:624 start_codon:yes stop_codon:yes gene_type:complete